MNSILTAIFSPRGSSTDRDAASSSPYPKSVPLPPKRTKRTSLPENQARRSMLSDSLELSNNESTPTSPKSRETRQTVQAPAKSPTKPSAKNVAKKPANKIVKKPVKQPAKKTAKQLTKQLEMTTGLCSAKVVLKDDAIMQDSVETRVVNKPNTSTEPQPNEPATKVEAECEVEPEVEPVIEYAFNKFTDHRWVGDSMEIRVAWQDGDLTWEREAVLHEDALDALLAHWKSQGGRPTNPNDPDLFNIFAIRKHTKDRKSLLVEWVGYGPKEASWLPHTEVEKTAPELVAQYWRSIKGARPRRRRK
ncbi:hypothetical protein E4U17_002556 [Claviceps sp. LM77 group G4]|nr:hypothetical protein E4U17_002556 [Claviceps sp. LM77 group G4]KAG6068029.1 hypothetical protein E4U16_008042 [Claviceps sp. LM84 group G4]